MRALFPIVLALSGLLSACGAKKPVTAPAAEPSSEPQRQPTRWAEGNYIINLYDAFGTTKPGLAHDFGFSALVRYNGKTILFDSGTNADVLEANTKALGIDLRDVDFAVASHAHFDHINGFDYLLEVNPDVTIYFPHDFYWGATLDFDIAGAEPGIADSLPAEQRYFSGTKDEVALVQSGRFWKANVEFVDSSREIAPGITLIATRSPYIGYFSKYPSPESDDSAAGDVKTLGLPELSLNLATAAGDVLLVGCSHSMVESIVRATKKHLARPVGLVFGGYHLLPYTAEQIRDIATRMRDELGVAGVAPAHCTGHAGFAVFREIFGERYVFAGLGSVTGFPDTTAPERPTDPGAG